MKNYRPQLLVLTGHPASRPALVDFAKLFSQNKNLLICGNVSRNKLPARVRTTLLRSGYEWLAGCKLKAFYSMVDGPTLSQGANALMQSCGVGRLSPNILLLGYKSNWNTCDRDEVRDYFSVLK